MFNKISDTGSNKDFGTTEDSRIYFNLNDSEKSSAFADTETKEPAFKW